jgi:MYXO-CTERM domain-containing protein
MRGGTLLLVLAAALAACDSRRIDVSDETQTEEIFGSFGFADVDVLVVVATSAGMAEEQEALAGAFAELLAELDVVAQGTGPDVLPDLHLGVVSADLGVGRDDVPGCTRDGDAAQLLAVPRVAGCPVPSDPFIRAAPRAGETNYPASATLAEVAACITPRRTDGCAYQQPLEAMKRALEGDSGFRRDVADLAVMIVADEDDCSAVDPAALFDPALGPVDRYRCVQARSDEARIHPLDRYRRTLETATPIWFALGGVTGPAGPVDVVEVDGRPALAPVCGGTGGDTGPSPRLGEFLDPEQHAGSMLGCTAEQQEADDALNASLAATGRELALELSASCFDNCPLDLRSDLPDIQAECEVTDSNGELVPPCTPGGPRDCWELAPASTCFGGFQVQVRGGLFERAECRVRTGACEPTQSFYDCSTGGAGGWLPFAALALLVARCRRRRV